MAEFPEWYDGKHVNEVKFCEEFLREHPMKSVNGTFFTVEGRVTDEDKLRREIYEMLKPYFSTGLGKRVNNLLDALRLEAYAPDLPIQRSTPPALWDGDPVCYLVRQTLRRFTGSGVIRFGL